MFNWLAGQNPTGQLFPTDWQLGIFQLTGFGWYSFLPMIAYTGAGIVVIIVPYAHNEGFEAMQCTVYMKSE